MEKKIIEFKERMEDEAEFRNLFAKAYNLDEIVDIAKENGYDLDMDEIMNDPELSDQFLEAVAAGRDDAYTGIVTDDRNLVLQADSLENAKKMQ